MKLEIELEGKNRSVEVTRDGGRWRGILGGRATDVDAIEITPGFYSVLIDGESFEVRIEPSGAALRVFVAGRAYTAAVRDPREWHRDRHRAMGAEGRQQIVTPMPGKIVRVLVKVGEAVEAGQALLVVEAMKMQNEIRSSKSGTVERLLAADGQAVAAGEVVAVVG
ncbi:MAG: biotin/lipoyl-containing protein [Candidatus Acidiferrales bacterium]